jgi:guanylate kinase
MTLSGVILYGPPASGKDTITAALVALEPRFELYQRLRVGDRPKPGYRSITAAEADELVRQGVVIFENQRYGNRYLVDAPEIDRHFEFGRIPVVHLGQVDGVRAVEAYGANWLTVHLRCGRETTALRAERRGDVDVMARLAAWDETEADLLHNRGFTFALRIDTDWIGPGEAAKQINQAVFADWTA